MARPPTVAEARPPACPGCGAPSCPFGGRIQLHGHGFRERQVRGPPGPGAKPVVVVVTGRRYRCVRCNAVLLVVPREVLPRRQYSAAAIGYALALWGLMQATALVVRRRISSAATLGFDAMSGWATLRRWAKAVRHGRLFASVPAADPAATLRKVAALAATALAANADSTTRGLPIEQRAFLGAAHTA
ncbi:MAG TPA: transposase family protein [Gaiellaceae bacterium]